MHTSLPVDALPMPRDALPTVDALPKTGTLGVALNSMLSHEDVPVPPALRLSSAPAGVRGVVERVALRGALGDRLAELGFTTGASIRVLRRAPFGGPLQVQIREFVLSLRFQDAACIQVAREAT